MAISNATVPIFGSVSASAIGVGVAAMTDRGVTSSPRRVRGLALVLLVVAVGVVGLATIATTWPPVSMATAIALAVLTLAAETDRRHHRLPDRLVIAAALPVAVLVVVAGLSPHVTAAPVLVGAAYLGVPVAVLHLVSPAGMGFGDVKAGIVVGAAVGVVEPVLALVAASVAAGLGAAWGVVQRRAVVPFGPFLVAAALAVLVLAALAGVEAAAWR